MSAIRDKKLEKNPVILITSKYNAEQVEVKKVCNHREVIKKKKQQLYVITISVWRGGGLESNLQI